MLIRRIDRVCGSFDDARAVFEKLLGQQPNSTSETTSISSSRLSSESWLRTVFRELSDSDLSRFSGVGLVFYSQRDGLPIQPMVPLEHQPKLPTHTIEESIELLKHVSHQESACHDGFHMVNSATHAITEVSQFLTPPIPLTPLLLDRAVGARFMSAALASLLPAVELTAIYSGGRFATMFRKGVEERIDLG